MLVMSDVAGDSRVLREATALAGRGHAVHIVGKDVPPGFRPPAGVGVASVSPGSMFRRGASATDVPATDAPAAASDAVSAGAPGAAKPALPRRLPPHLR